MEFENNGDDATVIFCLFQCMCVRMCAISQSFMIGQKIKMADRKVHAQT